MSNLTFSNLKALQNKIDQEESRDKQDDLLKYRNYLEQLNNAHQFEIELDNKLNTFDSSEQNRQTYQDKSQILNKQYQKYIEKNINEAQLQDSKIAEYDTIVSHKETQQFLRYFKSEQIKFTQFVSTLIKVYAIEFESSEQKGNFSKLLKSRLVTIDPEMISINALELCTRDDGISGLIEKIIDEVQIDINKKQSFKVNEAIVQELEIVKTMLEKKSIALQRKERDLNEAIQDVQKLKQNLCSQINVFYNELSRLFEDNYQNKLGQLTKKFTSIEHQLKQKIKMIETKGQQIQKSNTSNVQELQKLKQKNLMLEKQLESQKLKVIEIEKKLSQEKDQLIQAQKRIEKLQQKLQEEQSKDNKQQLQQLQQLNENLSNEKEKETNLKEKEVPKPQQQQQKLTDNSKYVKPLQNFIEQLLNSISLIPTVLDMNQKQFQYQLLPSTMIDNRVDIMNNLIQIIVNKTGFFQLYQLLFSFGLYQFKFNNQQLNLSQCEELIKSQKQKIGKYFINVSESKNRELVIALKSILDKKKKNKFILTMLLVLFDPHYMPVAQIISEIAENMSFIIDSEVIEVLILRTFDDKAGIEILLELAQQGPYFNQIIQQLSKFSDILMTMLWNTDLEFCEKLSILLQRICYTNGLKAQGQFVSLLQKKIQMAGEYELLKQNLNYILNQ